MNNESLEQQNEHAKKTKRYVAISLILMFMLSVYVAWTMSQNYRKEESQERYRLTSLYKESNKNEYTYDQSQGRELYQKLCMECHGDQGQGKPNRYPPLLNSQIVGGNFQIPLRIILHGQVGPIMRDDIQYNDKMPGFKKIHPQDIAHILNYIRSEFTQIQESIHPVEVIKTQVKTIDRKNAYTEEELNQIKE